jgi:Zn-dependent protease
MFNFNLATFISRALLLVPALTVHEYAHAWTANRFGDSTPRINGRLTLNPLVHLDPIGSLMVIVAGFGWAKPVPVNPYTLRQHSRSALMWVSLAGPLSNFLMAILAALPFQLELLTLNDLYAAYAVQQSSLLPTPAGFLFDFITINLVLGLFNLIPLPPLDGDKIAQFFMPDRWQDALAGIRPYGPMILILLFVIGPSIGLDFLGWIIRRPLGLMLNLLIGL